MADSPVTDELWDSFHQWVNMSSRELREWLSTDEASETADAFPDQAGSERSRGVLNILTKRRTDLSPQDVELMAEVVNQISTLRAEEDEEAVMGETGHVTGTKDKNYNLLWYTEACLSNALRLEQYVQDAERDGDNELADLFRKAQADSKKGAEIGKQMLAQRLT